MPDLKLLFLQMAVILTTARLMAAAARLVCQPEVVREMLGGILLGPSVSGRISPAALHGIFPTGALGAIVRVKPAWSRASSCFWSGSTFATARTGLPPGL